MEKGDGEVHLGGARKEIDDVLFSVSVRSREAAAGEFLFLLEIKLNFLCDLVRTDGLAVLRIMPSNMIARPRSGCSTCENVVFSYLRCCSTFLYYSKHSFKSRLQRDLGWVLCSIRVVRC